jgi:hypothetical protein
VCAYKLTEEIGPVFALFYGASHKLARPESTVNNKKSDESGYKESKTKS